MTVISDQGGRETQHGDDKRFCRACMQTTGVRFELGDVTGGRGTPRPNPKVVARAKQRSFTEEYKQKVLAQTGDSSLSVASRYCS